MPEEAKYFVSLIGPDAIPSALPGLAQSDFGALGRQNKNLLRLGVSRLLDEEAEVVKGVRYRRVERLVLLRRRLPEKERVHVEWNIFVEKRDCEIQFRLSDWNTVVIGQTWSYQRHRRF